MAKGTVIDLRSGEKVRRGDQIGVIVKPVGAGYVLVHWETGQAERVHAFDLDPIGRHD